MNVDSKVVNGLLNQTFEGILLEVVGTQFCLSYIFHRQTIKPPAADVDLINMVLDTSAKRFVLLPSKHQKYNRPASHRSWHQKRQRQTKNLGRLTNVLQRMHY